MARPQKSGLDYFPLNVDIDIDDKISLIESEHGAIGFAIIIKMLCKIYANSYFYEWGEKEQLLFSRRINVDINKVNDCINSALKWDMFDKTIYEKYGVLTSAGIQKRYLEAIGRRKTIEIIKNYWLIELPQFEKTEVKIINVDINEVNDDINTQTSVVNDDISTQSKVKKSKVNNNKENKRKENIPSADAPGTPAPSETKHKYGLYKHILLTDEEHKKLLDKYGSLNLEKIIDFFDKKIEMKGYKYKSHYLAILDWAAEAALEEQGKENRNFFKDFLES